MLQKVISNIFYFIFKILLGIYVTIFQGIRFKRNGFKVPKGPILFLSNHQSDWDPIYLNIMFFNKNIHFLAHDELFKNKFYRSISSYCLQCIKRGNSKSDITAIRTLLKVRNENKSIGIYPEGDIDFFGGMLQVGDSIAKLVKKMDMNVVLLTITGAHLRAPRWSKYPHRSHLRYNINDVLLKEEIQKMDTSYLFNRIIKGISHEENEYQKKKKIHLFGLHKAEWLELALFMCPKCKEINSLHSHYNSLKCDKCGFETKLNNKYQFKSKYDNYFLNTSEWNTFQLEQLNDKIANMKDYDLIIESHDLDFYYTNYGEYFKRGSFCCDIKLFKNGLYVSFKEHDEEIFINISEIISAKVQYKATLEIQCDNKKIRFSSSDKIWSAYLYKSAIEIIKKQINNNLL